MEIRHIPGKVNPADTITPQVKIDETEYTRQIKRMDEELVDMIRIPSTATDEDVQRKLNQLLPYRRNEGEEEIYRTTNFDRANRRAKCNVSSVGEQSAD